MSSTANNTTVPGTARKIIVHTLSNDFRAATKLVQFAVPDQKTLKDDQILVRHHYCGINASDINYTAGKYTPGAKPPMDAGFEAIGVIVACGTKVGAGYRVGEAVAVTSYGAFSEYKVYRAKTAIPIPAPQAAYLPLLVSGLTASIALAEVGEMKILSTTPNAKKETVLITAAAGGTGLFAVQLAKLAGHHVIATCSSQSKVDVLKRLGADRVINYKQEKFGEILKKEYPKGIDIVYESVGGDMFTECVKNLAVKGRCIVIGFVSGYADGSAWKGVKGVKGEAADSSSSSSGASSSSSSPAPRPSPPLPALILGKSASIRGFFLNDYPEQFGPHMKLLTRLIKEGKLESIVDEKHFVGLESVPAAIDYMYKGENVGKVVVDLTPELNQKQKSKL